MALSQAEIEKRVSDSYELPNKVLNAVPEPMVTVRTSAYQHGPYIQDCIEGVLRQETDFLFEFIIGEDFSTDGTREIVFEYAKKYPDIIRVFSADYNVGSKANGRRCIRAARGKYMALCEGDDYWTDPLKLQKQVEYMEKNPDVALTYHTHKNVDENGELIDYRDKPLPCTLMFINDFSNMPPTNNCPNGDRFLLTYFSLKGALKFLDDIAPSVRRHHEGGVMSMASEATKLDRQVKTWTAVYEAFKDSKLGSELLFKKNAFTYRKMLFDRSSKEASIAEILYYPLKVRQIRLYKLFVRNILNLN